MANPETLYENRRAFDAYYYGFIPTRCYPVDVILHAVAKAGKSFHHTEEWGTKVEPYTEHLSGYCPVDWIENAASQAAERMKQLEASNAELLEALQALDAAYKRLRPSGYPESDAEKQASAAIAKAQGEQA